MEMKTHDPSAIFAPVGPYTHGLEVVEASRLLFITGTVGLDKTGKAPEGIEAQCALAWRNIGAILEQAGMSVRNLVKVTCYLADRSYREANMRARASRFGRSPHYDDGRRGDLAGRWLAGGIRGDRGGVALTWIDPQRPNPVKVPFPRTDCARACLRPRRPRGPGRA